MLLKEKARKNYGKGKVNLMGSKFMDTFGNACLTLQAVIRSSFSLGVSGNRSRNRDKQIKGG